MRIEPKTENEVLSGKLGVSPGICNFTIINAEEKKSKAGNDMFVVNMQLWDKKGKTGYCTDYIVYSTQLEWKLRHLFLSIGKMDKYSSGLILPEDLVNGSGQCEVFIQQDKTGTYPDKLSVRDYISKEESKPIAKPVEQRTSPSEIDDDEDLPF